MVRPQINKIRSIAYSPTARKRSLSYGSHSLDSGIDESDSNSFVLVLDSVLNSPTPSEKDESATASGVAIDNKIEQAMDLVKSHLMLAVREEVEDLKQQIKLLEAKNNQLDQENKLLRASASPETLALLSRMQNP